MPRTVDIGKTKSIRSSIAPVMFTPVGAIFSVGERCFEVKRRPRVMPCEACLGCAFADSNCPSQACSSFDRADGVSVWFVKI